MCIEQTRYFRTDELQELVSGDAANNGASFVATHGRFAIDGYPVRIDLVAGTATFASQEEGGPGWFGRLSLRLFSGMDAQTHAIELTREQHNELQAMDNAYRILRNTRFEPAALGAMKKVLTRDRAAYLQFAATHRHSLEEVVDHLGVTGNDGMEMLLRLGVVHRQCHSLDDLRRLALALSPDKSADGKTLLPLLDHSLQLRRILDREFEACEGKRRPAKAFIKQLMTCFPDPENQKSLLNLADLARLKANIRTVGDLKSLAELNKSVPDIAMRIRYTDLEKQGDTVLRILGSIEDAGRRQSLAAGLGISAPDAARAVRIAAEAAQSGSGPDAAGVACKLLECCCFLLFLAH